MSTRYNNGSHYENHPKAAELENGPAHAHRVAEEEKGKQDHLTGQEHTRQDQARSADVHHHTHSTADGDGHATFGHHEIEALAHQLWQARGCPEGSPEQDWLEAVKQLRAHYIQAQRMPHKD